MISEIIYLNWAWHWCLPSDDKMFCPNQSLKETKKKLLWLGWIIRSYRPAAILIIPLCLTQLLSHSMLSLSFYCLAWIICLTAAIQFHLNEKLYGGSKLLPITYKIFRQCVLSSQLSLINCIQHICESHITSVISSRILLSLF